MGLLESDADRKWCAVGVARDGRGVGVDIGVSIDPQHVELAELLEGG